MEEEKLLEFFAVIIDDGSKAKQKRVDSEGRPLADVNRVGLSLQVGGACMSL